MLVFYRGNESLEVDALNWVKILEFFSEAGWQPNIPTYRLLKDKSITVSEADAHALSEAGRIVQEETMANPLEAYSTIDFDMGLFSEIIEFVSEGEFQISQK